ncbi:hypothetical protein C8J56DRAFT_886405 [Mycena floridula]|nr:hypothetical protein C8J56DRAFT_886405 [Mycena floridula]
MLSVHWNLSKVKGSFATFHSEWVKVAHILLKLNMFHCNHTNLEARVAHAFRKLERSSSNQAKHSGSPATPGQKPIAVAESPLNLALFCCNHSNLKALSVCWNLLKVKEWAVVAHILLKLDKFHCNHTNLEGNLKGLPATKQSAVVRQQLQRFIGNLVLKMVKNQSRLHTHFKVLLGSRQLLKFQGQQSLDQTLGDSSAKINL